MNTNTLYDRTLSQTLSVSSPSPSLSPFLSIILFGFSCFLSIYLFIFFVFVSFFFATHPLFGSHFFLAHYDSEDSNLENTFFSYSLSLSLSLSLSHIFFSTRLASFS